MKTPSFNELKVLVELLNEEFNQSQLQEVQVTDEGIVLTCYRYHLEPRLKYLVFDLDNLFPFVGYYDLAPWGKQKKSKPVGLFLIAHAKNLYFKKIEIIEKWGRVLFIELSQGDQSCSIEFRMIPKNANFIVKVQDLRWKFKSISWNPVLDLKVLNESDHINFDNQVDSSESEGRSIPFILKQWFERRSHFNLSAPINLKKGGQVKTSGNSTSLQSLNPFEKWRKQKEKDLIKKNNAVLAIQKQIDQYLLDPWSEVGEYLKIYGFKNLKPEWSLFVNQQKNVNWNIQNCFDKSKSAKAKINGAQQRLQLVNQEILNLQNLTEAQFAAEMNRISLKKNKVTDRKVEGRYRKLLIPEADLICYMGKSARDNLELLRKAKAWDLWLHLKDYPSAHLILHRLRDQKISEQILEKAARWLIKEGFADKKNQTGGRFSVVIAECRYVRPIKGDKLGRVTYNEGREVLIAI